MAAGIWVRSAILATTQLTAMWRMGAYRVAADDHSRTERLTLNYLTRTMLALAKIGDIGIIELRA